MRLSDFQFELLLELIAQQPLPAAGWFQNADSAIAKAQVWEDSPFRARCLTCCGAMS